VAPSWLDTSRGRLWAAAHGQMDVPIRLARMYCWGMPFGSRILEPRYHGDAMADDLKELLEQTRREIAVARAESKAEHEETRRIFGVVSEDVRRDVRAVADGVSANSGKIERLSSEVKQDFADLRAMIRSLTRIWTAVSPNSRSRSPT
jgi:hypothetical protein